jgi:phosphomevalonate kinase
MNIINTLKYYRAKYKWKYNVKTSWQPVNTNFEETKYIILVIIAEVFSYFRGVMNEELTVDPAVSDSACQTAYTLNTISSLEFVSKKR